MEKLQLKEIQKMILDNKRNKGFNTTEIKTELLLLMEELGEAVKALRKGDKDELAAEIVDTIIYSLGIMEMLGRDSYADILKKIELNEKREYEKNGDWYVRKDQRSTRPSN